MFDPKQIQEDFWCKIRHDGYGEVKILFRPVGVKFYESNALIRLDLDNYHKISIGDKCDIQYKWRSQYMEPDPEKMARDIFLPDPLFVLAFFELEGRFKKIRIKDIFCAVGTYSRISLGSEKIIMVPMIDRIEKTIPLLWAEGLVKYKA